MATKKTDDIQEHIQDLAMAIASDTERQEHEFAIAALQSVDWNQIGMGVDQAALVEPAAPAVHVEEPHLEPQRQVGKRVLVVRCLLPHRQGQCVGHRETAGLYIQVHARSP